MAVGKKRISRRIDRAQRGTTSSATHPSLSQCDPAYLATCVTAGASRSIQRRAGLEHRVVGYPCNPNNPPLPFGARNLWSRPKGASWGQQTTRSDVRRRRREPLEYPTAQTPSAAAHLHPTL